MIDTIKQIACTHNSPGECGKNKTMWHMKTTRIVLFKLVSKAGSSTSTRFPLELQMESCGSSKLKVCKNSGT